MKIVVCISLLFLSAITDAQELYPNTEPASNLPKGVLAFRLANQIHQEVNQTRLWQGYRFMFGINEKLTISQTFNFSNHHGYKLPADFIKANADSTAYYTEGRQLGNYYPYQFENFDLNFKYRFYTNDKPHEHLRFAAYLDLAGGNEAHDEAEPSLMGDNSGAALGFIGTYLKNKFAASITIGAIAPYRYSQTRPKIVMKYGNAINYSLSLGYLVLPFTYKSYKQTNVNVYVEFMGKSYEAAQVYYKGEKVSTHNVPSLAKGNYLEIRPAIQFIFLSNTRLDISFSRAILNQTYVKTNTPFYINLQHSFYF